MVAARGPTPLRNSAEKANGTESGRRENESRTGGTGGGRKRGTEEEARIPPRDEETGKRERVEENARKEEGGKERDR